jgi:branched-chain amino acid transport system permease protein
LYVIVGVLLAAAAVLSVLPFVLNPYLLSVFILIFIFILPTIGMRVSLLAGQTNIGVVAFFAIGGYASSILTMKVGVPFLPALLAGGMIAAVAGLLLGAVIMNLGDLYFIIITWGFLELVRSVAIKVRFLTGGPFGLVNIPPISIGGIDLSLPGQYFFILITTTLILFLLFRLEYSRLGLTWKSIAQAPQLSEAVGVNVYRLKLISFVISCFVAGLGGALYAHYSGLLQTVTFTFLLATTVIIWNFFGGTRHFIGPVIGAVVLLLAVEPLRGLRSFEMIAYAIVIILVTVFLPDGIISIPSRFARLVRHIRQSTETGDAEKSDQSRVAARRG